MQELVELAQGIVGAQVDDQEEVGDLDDEHHVDGEPEGIADGDGEDEDRLVGQIEDGVVFAHVAKAE